MISIHNEIVSVYLGDPMSKTHSECKERHVLVINDSQRRAVALDAAAYSIGRDPSNAIVLDTETISRQHAILLRVPIPGKHQYRYRVIDGNFEGKPSANGVFVNEHKSSTRDLANGDVIRFGQTIEASYLLVSMGEVEFEQYLEGISYQSLKSEMVNAKETLVSSHFMEEEFRAALAMEASKSVSTLSKTTVSTLPLAETLHEEALSKSRAAQNKLWPAVMAGLLLVMSGMAGLWVLVSQSQPSQSSAETRQPAQKINSLSTEADPPISSTELE
jgi:pSer/pThr/pTyr-binding forkhead associated (FHA) protein